MGMMPGAGGPSRWNIALYHSYRIQDEILIRPGVPVLDLLDGSATSNLGGAPRHELSMNGGVFHKGMGLRFEGEYRGATRADGSGLPGSTDLFFSDRFSMNVFLFVSMDQRGNLTKKLPFLKGSRIALRFENVFDDYVKVRDAAGNRPLSYQRGFLDPQGRAVEISFRKRF
jgi:iron complex outermembrane recepter protein